MVGHCSGVVAGPEVARARARYATAVEQLRNDLGQVPAGSSIRLGKKTSNLFRDRSTAGVTKLDVSAFDGVLEVDPVARTADVLGMTTYEHLVDVTLRYGLMPLVVPQLKTITLGGAVTGLGIESTSFRNGMPHESVLDLDVLTGSGEIVRASLDSTADERRDLFTGFPNSYGTLGYALRLRIELEPIKPFVALRHVRFTSDQDALTAMARICAERSYDGRQVDFVDGTAFAPDELYLTLGELVDTAPRVSDYTGQQIYYRSIQMRVEDHLTIRDYLWRWDTDWFWCSRAFGAQHRVLRRIWPRRWLRSDVYWKIAAVERHFGLKARFDRARGRAAHEAVVQDVEIPVERTAEFLDAFEREVGMRPLWLCPLRQRDAGVRWELYPLDPGRLYVNVGFWGAVALRPGESDGARNRYVERLVADLDGRKSLYSTSYYSAEEFAAAYGGVAYTALKTRYDPQCRLPDLYEKCVRRN